MKLSNARLAPEASVPSMAEDANRSPTHNFSAFANRQGFRRVCGTVPTLPLDVLGLHG